MDEFRLKVFLSVVKHKSFTEAARELYISQPAISKHIKELEEKFKTRLFDRTGSKIELTKAGILLNSHAETIINNYNALEFDMNQLIGRYSGELKIGASSTISQYVIPTLLAKFINTYPDIKLSLISGNTTEIENAILRNSIDLGLVEGNYHTNDIKYQDFMNDEIVLVTRAGSKYADLDEINIETLKGIPLILREHGSGTLEVIEKEMHANNLKLSDFNIILQLGSTESIKSFLLHTDCVALVSIRSVFNELKSGSLKIIDINDLEFKRKFQFITRVGTVTPIIEKFITFAFRHNQKL